MRAYVVHYGKMDHAGVLSIDCVGSFNTWDAAQAEMHRIIDDYINHEGRTKTVLKTDDCPTYQRVAILDELSEIQVSIAELDL